MEIEFEIDAENFKEFLASVSPIAEVEINVSPAGMYVKQLDEMKFILYNCLIKKESFYTYPEVTETQSFVIPNRAKLLDFLKRYSGKVKIKVTDTLIYFVDTKGWSTKSVLGHNDISADFKEPKLEYDGSFTLDSELFKEAAKDTKLLGTNKIVVKIQDKKLLITTKNATDERQICENVEFANCKACVGPAFLELVDTLNGKVEVFINTKEAHYPLTIKTSSKTMNCSYVVTPMEDTDDVIETKEEEPKKEEKKNE